MCVAGRASSTPSMDMLITLLSMGAKKYKELLDERKTVFVYLHEQLTLLAEAHGERVLASPNNKISIGWFENFI